VLLSFCLSCLLFSFSWQFSTRWYAKVLTGIPVAVIFGFLWFQPTIDAPTTFKCPLVPLVPCIGVLCNIFLIASLPIDAFYRALIWTAIGIGIYLLYGIRHSVLRLNPNGDDGDAEKLTTHDIGGAKEQKRLSINDGNEEAES